MSRHLMTLFRLMNVAAERGDHLAAIGLAARIRRELSR